MNFYAISALINAITSLVLGYFVFSKNIRGKANVSFSLFALSSFWWSISYFFWQLSSTSGEALLWSRSLMAGAIFLPVTYLHFVYSLVGLLEKRKRFLWSSYFVFFIFFLLNFTPLFVSHVESILSFPFWPMAGPAFSVFLFFWLLYVVYSTYIMLRYYIVSKGIIKDRLKYVIIGAVIGWLGGITNFFLWYKIPILPVGNISASIYLALVGYAIIRYRFMDIRVVGRKIFIYIGVGVFVYGLFYLVTWLYNTLFGSVFAPSALAFGLLIAPLFTFGFYSVDKTMGYLANKYFFVSLYSSQETLRNLTNQLSNYIDLSKIATLVVDTIKKAMLLNRVSILLIDTNTEPAEYQTLKAVGFGESDGISLLEDSFLKRYLSKTQKGLVNEELLVLADSVRPIRDRQHFVRLHALMDRLDASLCLPLISNKKLFGIIILGPKISGDAYSTEDLNLLNTLSKQVSIAIENARQHKRIQEFGEELQLKVDEQTEELRKTNQELTILDKRKTEFINIASHQLRTPITAIKGYADLMEGGVYGEISDTVGKQVVRMKELSDQVLRLVTDMLNISKMEQDKLTYHFENRNPNNIIWDICKSFEPQASKKNFKFSYEIVRDEVVCSLDKTLFTQAIENILDNAFKYTKEGSVQAKTFVKEGIFYFECVDTGIGIDKESQQMLFTKFSRSKNVLATGIDGTGIGMYLAKEIMKAHGGDVVLESKGEGEGVRATLSLKLS